MVLPTQSIRGFIVFKGEFAFMGLRMVFPFPEGALGWRINTFGNRFGGEGTDSSADHRAGHGTQWTERGTKGRAGRRASRGSNPRAHPAIIGFSGNEIPGQTFIGSLLRPFHDTHMPCDCSTKTEPVG